MEELYLYEVKVPKDRIPVLIGKEGSVKKKLQDESGSIIDIDEDGIVTVKGDDAIQLYTSYQIVRAIARGFNPEIAFNLFKQDYVLEIISLRDVVGQNQKQLERVRSRLIGAKGKSRRVLEELTQCYICVYGKTVSVIGDSEDIVYAHQAISMLVGGAMHRTVYKYLEKAMKERHIQSM